MTFRHLYWVRPENTLCSFHHVMATRRKDGPTSGLKRNVLTQFTRLRHWTLLSAELGEGRRCLDYCILNTIELPSGSLHSPHPFNRAIPDRSVHPSLASGSAIALLADRDPRRSCSRRKGHTTFCLARWKGLHDDDLSYALRTLSRPWLEVVREASRYNRVYRRAVCCTFHVYHWPVSALSIQRDGARRLSFGTEHATTGSSACPLLVQRMETDF
jgi:hypothetical protein